MRQDKVFTVYIVTNTRRGVPYTGVTSNLVARISQHRSCAFGGFSARWGLKRLVWFRVIDDAHAAIGFEKRLKRWRREWKFQLIEDMNPEWDDLWERIASVDDVILGGPG